MKKILLTLLTLMITQSALLAGGGPDAYGYVWRDNNDVNGPVYNWIDIVNLPTATQVKLLSDDNTRGPFAIGFPFHYYWSDVSLFWVGSNGYIAFQNAQLSSSFPNIPSAAAPQNFCAVMTTDLNFDGATNPAQCWYWTSPTNDTLVVSWVDVGFYKQALPNYAGDNTFQIILCKTDSSITYQYKQQDSIYTAGAANYLISGIENINGTIGLQSMINPPVTTNGNYIATPYAVKFYYPSNTTYQVTDAGPSWNDNNATGGLFVSNNTPKPFVMSTAVQNIGNTYLVPFKTTCRIINPFNQTQVLDSAMTSYLSPTDLDTLTMTNTFSPTIANTYRFRAQTFQTGDIVPANDIRDLELVVVDTVFGPTRLSFDNGTAAATGLSWIGGTGGAGVQFVPPFYPCKIKKLHYYILSNASSAGFMAAVYNDAGPYGTPGYIIDSVMVSASQIVAPGWVDVTLPNPIRIDSGSFYVAWMMNGLNINLGEDLVAPFSNRTHEVLGNSWAIYRFREVHDLMINCTIDSVHISNPGIAEISDKDFHVGEVYPNPASNHVIIPYSLDIHQSEIRYEVTDELGKKVLSGKISRPANGNNKLSLDISSFNEGIYQCSLMIDGKTVSRKFSVMK